MLIHWSYMHLFEKQWKWNCILVVVVVLKENYFLNYYSIIVTSPDWPQSADMVQDHSLWPFKFTTQIISVISYLWTAVGLSEGLSMCTAPGFSTQYSEQWLHSSAPPTSMWDRIPEKETSIPLTVYGSSTYWLPLNKVEKIQYQTKSPNTVKIWKSCSLLGHLLYVVSWTRIIGNLWKSTLLQTCYDAPTKTWIQKLLSSSSNL